MTFILTDIVRKENNLQLANRIWRPIAAEIARSNLIDDEKAGKIGFHLCTEVKASEAKQISEHLKILLKNGELPSSINPDAANLVVNFAGSSNGFDVC